MTKNLETGNLQAHIPLSLTARATISATFACTGRYITCGEEYGLVQGWARMPSKNILLLHPASAKLTEELLSVHPIEQPSIRGYRGRRIGEGKSTPKSSRDMGPPSPDQTSDMGRYNEKGHPALYLCESEYGVRRELSGEDRLFVQEFILPTNVVRIADLRELNQDSFLCATMWHTEMAGQEGYPTEFFSQIVANIIGRSFDGMAVPGVRGDDSQTYSNIVIFPRLLKHWPEWVVSKKKPYELK